MSFNASTDTAAVQTQQGQPIIHALFRKSQFLGHIDYDAVFRGPSILATRLLDSPQALHWVYAFLYGTNAHTDVPIGYITLDFTVPPKGDAVPKQYACNKAIGQLSAKDIEDVRKALTGLAHKYHFQVRDVGDGILGETAVSDLNKEYAIISIDDSVYRRALLRQSYSVAENALFDLELAMIMLHEIAHALNFHYMRGRVEGFFEGCLIAEHGFELESRIFGLCPHIPRQWPALRSTWYPWQTRKFFTPGGYDADFKCRHEWKLPKTSPDTPLDPDFAIKLCSDEFWEGEYLQQGAVALIPDVVQKLCREGRQDIMTKAIPLSIRELFREDTSSKGKSYAEKKYPAYAKPLWGFRKPLVDSEAEDGEGDGDGEGEGGTDTTDAEWSEGEGFDASGYDTEDMTDASDDDATIRGDSDDEMTEVEEWVSRPPEAAVKKPAVKIPAVEVKGKVAANIEEFDFEAQLREIEKRSEMRELRLREEEEERFAFFH